MLEMPFVVAVWYNRRKGLRVWRTAAGGGPPFAATAAAACDDGVDAFDGENCSIVLAYSKGYVAKPSTAPAVAPARRDFHATGAAAAAAAAGFPSLEVELIFYAGPATIGKVLSLL